MIRTVESSTSVSDEPYFLTYSTAVSRMNGWQLAEELARRVDTFDLLNDDLGKFNTAHGDSNVKEAEKKIS